MQLDSRPISIPPRDWPDQSSASSSSHPPTSSPAFMSTPSVISQRRRSSAAHTRPAAPPPNHPIPNIPSQPSSPPRTGSATPEPIELSFPNHVNGSLGGYPYTRPGASANLAAVAAYSSSRPATSSAFHAASQSPQPSASSSVENLSDPPPRSSLPSSRRSPELVARVPNDNYLLTPPEPRSTRESKPSSRRALMRALELAREAVSLDSTNDDPIAAVQAYGKSVALLSEVMERVRRGEDSTDSSRRRNGRRRSIVAQEEEVKRLKSIHDTYADRMNILSLIYSIPPMPHPTASVYSTMSASTDSTTQPSSPASTSPTSDTSESSQRLSYPPTAQDDYDSDHHNGHDQDDTLGAMMFGADTSNQPTPVVHPYAAPSDYDSSPPVAVTPATTVSPSRPLSRRPRSGSASLPPPAPPPSSLPPPPPALPLDALPNALAQTSKSHLDVARQRGDSISHKRTSSGSRLAALKEENERPEEAAQGEYRKQLLLDTPKTARRESHPLPPLPPSSSSDVDTPTMSERAPPSPKMSTFVPRNRGVSQPPARSDSSNNLINASTNQGTIYQRRSKHSAASTPRSTSPTESTASIGSLPPSKSSIPSRPAASSLPSLGTAPVATRNRALSQPDRRSNGRSSPDPPPLPISAGANGLYPRKASITHRSNSGLNLPPLTVQTDIPPSASLSTAASLIPPPPSLSGNLPTTPPSPLPPVAPNDPLRKPYYMMNLLLITMTSNTGGYITRRLHVPQEVWSQGGVKLGNVPEKIRAVEILCSSLEELQVTSADSFGAGNVSSGMALGIGSIGRKEGEAWVMRLEEFSTCCDNVVANFGKKLGVGEGFAVKKNSGWGRVARGLDKLTNGKNLDSPSAYVQGLKQLFQHAQLLDEHAKAVLSHPVAPSYAALPADLRSSVEAKLRRLSEFFASVVLTFVIRDLSQLLDKYSKKCEKWLAE